MDTRYGMMMKRVLCIKTGLKWFMVFSHCSIITYIIKDSRCSLKL